MAHCEKARGWGDVSEHGPKEAASAGQHAGEMEKRQRHVDSVVVRTPSQTGRARGRGESGSAYETNSDDEEDGGATPMFSLRGSSFMKLIAGTTGPAKPESADRLATGGRVLDGSAHGDVKMYTLTLKWTHATRLSEQTIRVGFANEDGDLVKDGGSAALESAAIERL
ncbi:hypothetical protein CONPUDRAFT_155442 [Coniophora puteana RWD-64-598 SS2]|uniref:Uncharacterized protein n=1 Tax=Coniophora puteana (strain RWD-64-598) TaxID=741705 RepID=A0A5M3MMS4_CONPW|nr:uncharacterized protein CONPUDRAFT_155442 [Coniophora puteana RWD-64-598 SS2]EIW80074.1 hypothetical protein CONPUDRAFT_155442 [Coniophora puteana RWD-64-598 SS2]